MSLVDFVEHKRVQSQNDATVQEVKQK